MALENLDWNGVINLIANYYSADASAVESTLIANGCEAGNVTEAFKMLENSPYEIFYNADGSVRSYAYNNIGTVMENGALNASALNSNVVQTKTAIKIPLNTTLAEPATPSTPVTWKSGLASAGNFVFGSLIPAVAAANVGITLGKTIDGALYNVNPDFFDSIGWGTLDPETWNSITSGMEDSTSARVFNTVFKLDPNTGKSQAYIDENAYAYLTKILYDKGFFNVGSESASYDGALYYNDYPQPLPITDVTGGFSLPQSVVAYVDYTVNSASSNIYLCGCTYRRDESGYSLMICSDEPYSITAQEYNNNGTPSGNPSTITSTAITVGDKTLYRNFIMTGGTLSNTSHPFIYDLFAFPEPHLTDISSANRLNDIAKIILLGTITSGGIEGIGTQTGATTPSLDPNDDIASILNKLRTQYPELWGDAVTANVVQPDGSVKTYNYVPISQSDNNPNPTEGYDPSEQPISGTSSQADPSFNPEDNTDDMIQYILDILTNIPNYNDESTGEGSTPPVVIPPGSAEALYKIYNPTESQINSFGAWLWSSNFVDQLLKMFNDPMQAIISLHKVFCSPSVGGTAEIKVGYLNSGVTSNYVDEQYVTVSCGSVQLPEDFQNVFDYPPFTEVSLYLPFIGIVRLDTNDVMRSTITVTYYVDVLTGSCLAEVSIIRDMVGGVLYQYAGDCSVHYPLSSGSYMGIVGALLGVAGTVASGGALAPMALGVASGVMGARSSVERSGGFSGNAGAMGSKKPYLIIQRPQTNMPTDFNKFLGKPANETVKISECTGFISCVEVHALNTICTESEMSELITLLKSGILI